MARPRTLAGDRAVLPALRVEASMLAQLKVEAAAEGVPVSTVVRRIIAAHQVAPSQDVHALRPLQRTPERAEVLTDLESQARAKRPNRARNPSPPLPSSTTPHVRPRQCACPRPRPKATTYGLCTGCGGRR